MIASLNRVLKLGLLSKLAERVTFVLIPPLLLIFLVLGTIFLGVATPTEGGAMGAVGALIMATLRRRLDLPLLKQALTTTTKLSSFVMFILVGATIFSMVFQAADGPVWVEHLLAKLPGKGKMTVTGNLRDVMKESISAAASYVRSRAIDFGIEPPLFDKRDIRADKPREIRRRLFDRDSRQSGAQNQFLHLDSFRGV